MAANKSFIMAISLLRVSNICSGKLKTITAKATSSPQTANVRQNDLYSIKMGQKWVLETS